MNIVLLQRKSVFIIGFVIGLVPIFLCKYASHNFESPVLHIPAKDIHNLVESSENYKAWRHNQNMYVSKVNLDTFIYGTQFDKRNKEVILEAEWLKNKVPVTCIVFVEKLKFVVAIKDTWGKHCNQLLFFSVHLKDVDLSVINLGIKYTSSWQLLCEAMNYVWKRRNEISVEWLIFVKDDTFVIPENLRYMLASLDFRQPYYLGHAVVLWGVPYNVAQAGYVLSYEALHKIMKMFDTSEKCSTGGKYWKNEDYYLGKHLGTLGIHPLDTRDKQQRGTFHGFSLNTLFWGVAKPGSYYTRALYPPGSECCSDRTITFNVAEANKMRTINYILYRLNTFEIGIYGNKPAPTPIPENEIWKLALREEFNLTDIEEISSDRYFQIWRTKYSEPEQFIARNFRNKSKALKPIVEIYEMYTKEPNR